jgi:hypothetical protein
MAKTTFFIKSFRDEIDKQADKALQEEVFQQAVVDFDDAKDDLINEFEVDLISQEIAAGENAGNISNTLNGKGNLFSFIGFNQGEKPVQGVSNQLRNEIRLYKTAARIKRFTSTINFHFTFTAPTMKDIDSANPMPSWDGRGWVSAIRRGIGGFWSYIYWRTFPPEKSRSTTGLQADNILRDEYYEPPDYYLPEMLRDFIDRIKGK